MNETATVSMERRDVRDGSGHVHNVRLVVEIPATSFNITGVERLIRQLEGHLMQMAMDEEGRRV